MATQHNSRGANTLRTGIAVAVVVALGLVAGVYAMLNARSEAPPSTAKSVAPPSYSHDSKVRFVVYGDSVSQGDSAGFAYKDLGPTSWVAHVDKAKVDFVGGVAMGGMTAAKVLPLATAQIVGDLWVAELGTNAFGDPLGGTLQQKMKAGSEGLIALERKINTSGDPRRFVVMAIGPMDAAQPDHVVEFAKSIRKTAEAQGWSYLDPWTDLRKPGDPTKYASPDLTRDGLHPNEKGAALLGAKMTELMVALDARLT